MVVATLRVEQPCMHNTKLSINALRKALQQNGSKLKDVRETLGLILTGPAVAVKG